MRGSTVKTSSYLLIKTIVLMEQKLLVDTSNAVLTLTVQEAVYCFGPTMCKGFRSCNSDKNFSTSVVVAGVSPVESVIISEPDYIK